MKKLITYSCLMLALGCASFNKNTFNTEKLVADSSVASYSTFNQYYHQATNGLAKDSTQLARLEYQRKEANAFKQRIGQSLKLVEDARIAYLNNKSDTNKMQVTLLVNALTAQKEDFRNLVQAFIKQGN